MKTQLKNLMYGALFALPYGAFSQSFTENMGSVSSTSTIAQQVTASGFANPSLTFSGTGDVRNTSPSTGYTGASGNAMKESIMMKKLTLGFLILVATAACSTKKNPI